jgi:cold shock protein
MNDVIRSMIRLEWLLIFVHFSAIQAGGFRSLQEGQQLQFEVTKGPKGWQAENVRAV